MLGSTGGLSLSGEMAGGETGRPAGSAP